MALEFEIRADHSDEVLRELDDKIEAILEAWEARIFVGKMSE